MSQHKVAKDIVLLDKNYRLKTKNIKTLNIKNKKW